MKNILFLAPYPTSKNIKDGMISRVKAVDVLFEKVPRTYLNVSLKSFWEKEKYTDGLVEVYSLNFIRHFWSILKIVKSFDYIYSHSIYSLQFLWILIPNKARLILDIHGVVPEEQKYLKQSKLKTIYYDFMEQQVFRKIQKAVCVTNSMCSHYRSKYDFFTGDYIVYSIVPDNLYPINEVTIKDLKEVNKNKINVIYSGGAQGWQNVDMMLDKIKQNQSPNVSYTILTGDISIFEEKIKSKGLNSVNIVSRNPSDLWKDYLAADYAFILRDDDIVNNVACPTKLIEYLYYGLIPIVLSPNIGDYFKLGYDFISIENMNSLKKTLYPSEKNMTIAQELIYRNETTDLVKFVYS